MGDSINNVSLLPGQRYIPKPSLLDPLPAEEENYFIRQGLSIDLGDTNIHATLFADRADPGTTIYGIGNPITKETLAFDLDANNRRLDFGPSISLLHYANLDENGRGHIETAPAIGFYVSFDLDKNPVCALTGLLCD